LKFNHNHCHLVTQGSQAHFDHLQVMGGASVIECDSNIFDCDSPQRAIGVDPKATATTPTNNTMRMVPTGAARKKLMISGSGETDGTGLVVA